MNDTGLLSLKRLRAPWLVLLWLVVFMDQKSKAAFFNNDIRNQRIDKVFGRGRREALARLCQLYPHVITSDDFDQHREALRDVEVIFSTWGMPSLDDEQVAAMPALQAVFYAAGTVKPFAEPFLRRGVTVISAWAANAVPVAEFCLGQILLSCKGYWRNTVFVHSAHGLRRHEAPIGHGAYGETIALIGGGQVGRKLIEVLKPFKLDVLLVDPYLSDEQAAELGVRLVSMEEAFRRAYVVSNHLPNLPTLKHIFNAALFASMRQGATFINTGRGAQVHEADLISVFTERPDLTALLDVTFPEPPDPTSPLHTLPNVHLSSHIAGSANDEILRMADEMIAEFQRWQAGKPLHYQVTLKMLEIMA